VELPSVVVPETSVTGPVGFPPPGATGATVAVKITGPPDVSGLLEEKRTVVVAALETVCPPARVPLLEALRGPE
jgi:hypothetical protein